VLERTRASKQGVWKAFRQGVRVIVGEMGSRHIGQEVRRRGWLPRVCVQEVTVEWGVGLWTDMFRSLGVLLSSGYRDVGGCVARCYSSGILGA
jgi:hypothetical protein